MALTLGGQVRQMAPTMVLFENFYIPVSNIGLFTVKENTVILYFNHSITTEEGNVNWITWDFSSKLLAHDAMKDLVSKINGEKSVVSSSFGSTPTFGQNSNTFPRPQMGMTLGGAHGFGGQGQ